MSDKKTLRRLALAATTGALISASSLVLARPAHADELTYLQLLNSRGFMVYDTAQALRTGYALCEALNTYNGLQVAQAFYAITDYSVPDPQSAALWVESAVEGLCPWHDHRNDNQQQGFVA